MCWECLFPISIGPISMGSATGAPDTPNPGSPICFCGTPIPRIGLSLGMWEPARLIDVTRTPWCFPNLGGLTIDPGLGSVRGRTGSSGGDGASGSVWHAHYYVYPLLSWIGALLDLGCLEGGGLDIAWVSELDPAWLDDELAFLLNPEAALFAGLPAQAACARRLRRCLGGPAARSTVLVRGLPGRDVSPDGQCHRPCRRGAGLAAGGPAPGLPAAQAGACLGDLGIGCAVRALSHAGDEEIPIPLADDPTGPGDLAAHGVQPDRALLGAVGNPYASFPYRARTSAICCGENVIAACSEEDAMRARKIPIIATGLALRAVRRGLPFGPGG